MFKSTTSGLSRRRFLELGGASISAASLMGSAAFANTPKKGGTFRIGFGDAATTDSLDPATFNNAYIDSLAHAVWNHLVEIDTDGSLIPELAESWDVSADAKTWVFKLRGGIEFHDGRSLTAVDVVASLNYHRGENSASAVKSLLDPVVDIRQSGEMEVTIELDAGNASFPFLLSDYHFIIAPASGETIDPTGKIGTGAYTLESFDPGVRARLKRNANYWKEGRGHFDEIEMLVILDAAARTNALVSGEVDAINRVDIKTVSLLKRQRGIQIKQTTGTQHFTLPMDARVAPFSDNNVRLALKHALDREAMLRTLLRGYGAVANDHPIGPSNAYFNTELEQRAYDPDKAKFYLKQAGMETLKVQLHASDAAFAGGVDGAVLFKENAAAAGIDIDVVREPGDGYWSNVWMKKPWAESYWSGRPTEDWMFTQVYSETADWNESHWTHQRFNELLVAARVELDDNKRREMYWEMQSIMRDEGSSVIPLYASYVFAAGDKVAHGELGANWDVDGLRALERWWFA
jgi:peptide/nickel transport system substrate-binding protein